MLEFANLQFGGVHRVAKNYCNVVYMMVSTKRKKRSILLWLVQYREKWRVEKWHNVINTEHEKKPIRPEIANFLWKSCFVTSLSELHLKHLPEKLLLLSESSFLELDQKTHAGTCVEKQQDQNYISIERNICSVFSELDSLPGKSNNSWINNTPTWEAQWYNQ